MVSIEVSGVKSTDQALKVFAPDIRKALRKTIRTALNETRDAARARYPNGDWVVRITDRNMLGVIAARGGGTRAPRWADSSPGIRAAIFEFAGHSNPGATPQAKGLIESLTRRYGQPGRFLWDAWDATGEQALDSIRQAVSWAEAELQARLDAAGEAY